MFGCIKERQRINSFPGFCSYISVAIFVLIMSAGVYLDNLDTEQGGSLAPLILLIFGANFLIVFNSALCIRGIGKIKRR